MPLEQVLVLRNLVHQKQLENLILNDVHYFLKTVW